MRTTASRGRWCDADPASQAPHRARCPQAHSRNRRRPDCQTEGRKGWLAIYGCGKLGLGLKICGLRLPESGNEPKMTAKSKKPRHGGPRPNSGRKPGTKNPATLAKEALLEEVIAKAVEGETTPLEVMLQIMRAPESPAAMKFEAAKAAAPYVHPRLSQVDSRVTRVNDVSELTPEQIDRLLAERLVAGKAAAADGAEEADRLH